MRLLTWTSLECLTLSWKMSRFLMDLPKFAYITWYRHIPAPRYCRYIWIYGSPREDIADSLSRINPVALPFLRGIVCRCACQVAVLTWGEERAFGC
ncbi:hypothetical protein BT69DRAFT_1029090 [Atractiella rhizophila]|nr:hypothetical protein BT69DRAFT_1029090 [Atractiella rhizophila]